MQKSIKQIHWAKKEKNYHSPELANCKNTKETLQAINELLNRKSETTTINEIYMNSNYIIGEKEIAKKFDKYFSEVMKSEVLKRDPNDKFIYV